MSKAVSKTGAARSPLRVIFLTIAIDLIGFGVIIPLLPLYAKSFGASGVLVALLFASYSLMQFVFSPVWGRLSDRVGRRPVLLLSIAGNALAFLVFALSKSYTGLLLARLVAGACTANISVATAYAADVTAPEDRAKGMGIVGAAFGIGFVVGPFLGGELSKWGHAAPAYFAAALAALNWVFAYWRLPESLPPERRLTVLTEGLWARFTAVRVVPGMARLVTLIFWQVCAFSMLEVSFVLFANRRLAFDAVHCGRMFGYIGIVMVVVQGGLIGRCARRFGERSLAFVGLALAAIGMLAIPFTPQGSWPVLLVWITFTATGQGFATSSLQSMLSQRTPTHQQGLAMGVSQSASALARVVGPATAGWLFDRGTENTPFWAGGIMLSVALCVAMLWLGASAKRLDSVESM